MKSPITPMMQQYLDIKAEYPSYLLFYRMGDFYELFNDDAVQASNVLQITLTKHRSSKKEDTGMPMCGVPHHAAEQYIAKLLANGLKVALCDQTETPAEAKKRGGSKALVKREVVRLYTGGTLTEDSMLLAESNNYLVATAKVGESLGLAWLDLSTGEFNVTTTCHDKLASELARLQPQEILTSNKFVESYGNHLLAWQDKLTVQDIFFAQETAQEALQKHYELKELGVLGLSNQATIRAAGALVDYVSKTQIGRKPNLATPAELPPQKFVQIDAASRQHLELTTSLKGDARSSLMGAINQTLTPAGNRLLRDWVQAPLADVAAINKRQATVASALKNQGVRANIRDLLKQTSDIGRALSRLALDRGGPRDLHALRGTLQHLPQLLEQAQKLASTEETLTSSLSEKLQGYEKLATLLTKAIIDDAPALLARDGNFIKAGYSKELDEYKDLATNGRTKLSELERVEAENTGISSLKIRYNKVWGYYLEITKSHASKVPEHYVHRQTTTNAQRFSIPELMDLERNLSAAESNALAMEQSIFDELVIAVKADSQNLLETAHALAILDVITAGAELAEAENYARPVIDDSEKFEIIDGRHPVVEQTVKNFVANSTNLSNGKLWLITGPNMAGKSTFLRQNALITILAQMGYFVPAESAHIGVRDAIYTRIGAADDLSQGQSTFMVEMLETANILKKATSRSLVVLDEIGRGTATYDGLAIAWACVEHLITQNRSAGLFATHYHELVTLSETFNEIENYHVAVKEWKGEIVFLHEVKEGNAPRSYGVHVGKLAGLPEQTVKRASEILRGLEKASAGKEAASAADLPLFTAPSKPAYTEKPEPSEVEDKLVSADLDDLSPRQAQELLYSLKSIVRKTDVHS